MASDKTVRDDSYVGLKKTNTWYDKLTTIKPNKFVEILLNKNYYIGNVNKHRVTLVKIFLYEFYLIKMTKKLLKGC